MAVKNLHGVGNTKPITAFIPIPPKFEPVWKFEIVTDTETIDFTRRCKKGNYIDGVTDNIGSFEFQILDPSNSITDRIEEYDTVNVYLDYGSSATTLRFSGKIESIGSQSNIYLTITGRSLAMITTGINVIYDSNGLKTRKEILEDIIDKYFSGTITKTNIEADSGQIERNYFEIPFWQVVKDLCNSGGRSAYIDVNGDFNYFVKGSRENSTECIVEGVNLINPDNYGKDTEQQYTEARVYGATIEGIPIIATSDRDTTNTKGIVKQLKIDNASAITTDQASEQASAEFESSKVAPSLGTVKSLLLPSIAPGENVFIAAPINKITPGMYEVESFKHEFTEKGSFRTHLMIYSQKLNISRVIRKNFEFQAGVTSNNNPNSMDFSKVIQFLSDSGTHTNTVINENYLKVSPGQSTGRWESDIITLDSNPTALEIRWTGEGLIKNYATTSSNLWISTNGGTTWVLVPAAGVPSTIPTGRDIKVRTDLNASDAKVKAIGIFYKL